MVAAAALWWWIAGRSGWKRGAAETRPRWPAFDSSKSITYTCRCKVTYTSNARRKWPLLRCCRTVHSDVCLRPASTRRFSQGRVSTPLARLAPVDETWAAEFPSHRVQSHTMRSQLHLCSMKPHNAPGRHGPTGRDASGSTAKAETSCQRRNGTGSASLSLPTVPSDTRLQNYHVPAAH